MKEKKTGKKGKNNYDKEVGGFCSSNIIFTVCFHFLSRKIFNLCYLSQVPKDYIFDIPRINFSHKINSILIKSSPLIDCSKRKVKGNISLQFKEKYTKWL